MTSIDTFVTRSRDRMLNELKAWLAIPSISTLPTHERDCRRAAEFIAEHLRGLGCTAELLASDTHPVVWARGPRVPGRPTVVVYGHYDVQPPDPLEEWKSPPFEPTERNGNLYARGATDDKGQTFAIIKALEAVSQDGKPPVNVHFLIEGQEECGSGVLFDLLARRPDLVDGVDAVILADMPYFAPGIPALEIGLRGICYCEISVRTLDHDLHSGLYGGVAPNAHETLVQILGRLKAPSGRIRIPGLYDAVERPDRDEREGWQRLPFSERKYMREEVGAKALTGLKRYSVFERTWALPTFDIHGIMGGFTGIGAKTVIPAEATAKVSLRLVPKQRAKSVLRLLTRAVKAATPPHARSKVTFIHGADPVLLDVSAPPFEMMSQAFEDVVGRRPVPTRSGGSIPVVPALGSRGAPVVMAGIGLPDDALHAPNEKIGIEQFVTGVRVFARFFAAMGARGR